MKKASQTTHHPIEQLNCFGDYMRTSPFCASHCALRLRCVIEQNHNMHMELLEDLIASEALSIKIQ
jgi:hypothetical protein